MPLQLDTQLMPQALPGRTSRATCAQLKMVAADSHRVAAFALDEQRQLTVWCSTEEGYVRWVPVPILPGDSGPGKVIDFDVIGNVGEGRRDDTIDLVMLMYRDRDSARLLYYWPRVPAATSPEGWRLLFAAAQPLVFPHQHPLEVARLGVMPLPVRHVITGSYNTSQWWEMHRVGSDASGRVVTALDPLPAPRMNGQGGPSSYSLAAAVGKRLDSPVLEDGVLVATRWDREEVFAVDLLLPQSPQRLPEQWPVRFINGAPGGSLFWPGSLRHMETRLDDDLAGASFLINTEGDTNFNHVMTLFQVLDRTVGTNLPVSVPGLVPADGPIIIVPLSGEGQRIGRFERYRPVGGRPGTPAQLVLTTSRSLQDAAVASVPLFDDVQAFCACRCGDARVEPTALHVMVGYADGGIELFTQDSVSSQWQRFRLTDDDLRDGWHTVTSYSTRIEVRDDSGSPKVGAPVSLRTRAPCQSMINGVSVHLTPLIDQIVSTDGSGVVNLVQPVDSLGATLIDVSLLEGTTLPDHPPGAVLPQVACRAWAATPRAQAETLNPMVRVAERLGAVSSGADLQQARASDGGQPFAHVPLARCDEASAALQRLLPAYHATLAPSTPTQMPLTVMARTRLHWQGPRVKVVHTDWADPVPQGEAFGAVGDMLGYLWTLAKDEVAEIVTDLEWLSNGLADLVVTIGNTLWRATLAIASQAAEFIDWALQKSLGVSLEDLVNWLGRVFDWPAILRTQKVLKHYLLLNQRFAVDWLRNDAPAAVDCATAQVKEWLAGLPDLSPAVRDVLQRPAKAGDQGLVQDRPPAAGPDALWGQTQIGQFGGMASFGPQVLPGADTIIQAIESAGRAFENDTEKLQQWFSSVDLQTASPLQVAEEALALVGATAFDTLEGFTQALLPGLADLVQQLAVAADAPVNIPVLSALYRDFINPGETLSALEALTLVAAIAGHVGSELVTGEPMVSDEMAERILAAQRLEDLLIITEEGHTTVNTLSAYNGISSLTAGLCKSLYFVLWSTETWAGLRTPALVTWRVMADLFSWLIAFSWAIIMLGQAERLGRDKQAYTLNVVYLFLAALAHRSKDVVDLRYANSEVPPGIKTFFGYFETIYGAFALGFIGGWQTASSITNLSVPKDSDPAAWTSLIVLSDAAVMSTAVYYALSFERFTTGDKQVALRAVRTAANALRSTAPLVSSFVLFRCASQGWSAPGLMSD